MPYRYIPAMPYYTDPDAREAEALIQASYLLQSVGRKSESENLAEQARTLFDDAPYDGKKKARVLGNACCRPDGVLSCHVSAGNYDCEVASRPCPAPACDKKGGAETKPALAEVRAEIQACASDLDLGWLPADQLSAALSGKKPRRHAHTLVKAVQLYQDLAASMQKALDSGNPAAVRHIRESWLKSDMRYRQIGPSKAVSDSRRMRSLNRVREDEGIDTKQYGSGYWLLWVPEKCADDAAGRILKSGSARDVVESAVQALLPMRRGAWIPGESRWDWSAVAKSIVRTAAEKAALATGAGLDGLGYVIESFVYDIDTALNEAWNARRAVLAYRIIAGATARDPDSMAVLSGMDIVKDGMDPALDINFLKQVAQAAYMFGYRSGSRVDYAR